MINMIRYIFLLIAFTLGSIAYSSSYKQLTHSRARLVLQQSSIAENETIHVGLHIKIDPLWHVYWKNPGDSGAAPIITLEFSEQGFRKGDILYPNPKRIVAEPLVTFGYEDEVLFLIPITAKKGIEKSQMTVKMNVEYLICKVECLPVFTEFEAVLGVGTQTPGKPSDDTKIFAKFADRFPQSRKKTLNYMIDSSQNIKIKIPNDDSATYDFFPEQYPWIVYHPMERFIEDGEVTFKITTKGPPEDTFSGLLVRSKGKQKTSYEVLVRKETGYSQLLYFSLLALFGGLILNLMPCVFPILGIKMLSILKQARGSRVSVRIHSLCFVFGILASFLLFGVTISLMKSFGQVLGWGFQLQSPLVIAGLSLIFVAIALNFLGLWDLNISFSMSPQKEGMLAEFLSGVLAVVVASPCTAPFMGAALGFAVTQSIPILMAIFLSLGIGFAMPFLIFAAFPSIVNSLPGSGPWLLKFKKWMALPLFLTVVWLSYIYFSIQGFVSLLLLTLSIAVLGLVLLTWKKNNKWVTLILLVVGITTTTASLKSSSQGEVVGDDFWHLYQQDRHEIILQSAYPIFINFTATWCITCQVNEISTFRSEKIRKFFKEKNVKAVKVDWTKKQEHIAKLIQSYGRISVPLYIFLASAESKPKILPELLSPDMVINELQPFFSESL